MWFKKCYKFKANDSEFINIRDGLTRGSREVVSKNEGDICPLNNYSRDSQINFMSTREGDYIIVSCLDQDRPTMYQSLLRLRRAIDVISTDKGVVKIIMQKTKQVVEEKTSVRRAR